MTRAGYSIYLDDPFGVRLGDASNFVKLQYTRVVNDVGTLKLWLPADFDTNLIRIPDGRIEVWRRLPGTSREYLDTETVWLIKAMQWDRDDNGNVVLLIEADTPLSIFRDPGRIFDFPVTQGSADLNDSPDNMIKQAARNNASASLAYFTDTGTTRDLLAFLSIDPDVSQGGTSFEVKCALKPVLNTMQDIAKAAPQRNGVYIAFDIVAPSANAVNGIQPLVFRTYIQQRGVDHRFPNGINPVIVGGELGNVGQATLRLDYRKEITFARAGGAGQALGQVFGSGSDLTRIGASPWGRRETYVQNTQETSTTALDALAQAVVRGGRPRALYRGRLLSVPGCQYGLHWSWGDYVTVQDFGQSFDARVEAVTVTVEKGQEKIDAWVRNDE